MICSSGLSRRWARWCRRSSAPWRYWSVTIMSRALSADASRFRASATLSFLAVQSCCDWRMIALIRHRAHLLPDFLDPRRRKCRSWNFRQCIDSSPSIVACKPIRRWSLMARRRRGLLVRMVRVAPRLSWDRVSRKISFAFDSVPDLRRWSRRFVITLDQSSSLPLHLHTCCAVSVSPHSRHSSVGHWFLSFILTATAQ